jgi:hypothetical protein
MTRHTDVDVTPLRDAFLRSEVSLAELCRWLEWLKPNGTPDTSRLGRRLGLLPSTSHGQRQVSKRIGIDTAALIADALSIDPWEVGI